MCPALERHIARPAEMRGMIFSSQDVKRATIQSQVILETDNFKTVARQSCKKYFFLLQTKSKFRNFKFTASLTLKSFIKTDSKYNNLTAGEQTLTLIYSQDLSHFTTLNITLQVFYSFKS